jgi:hypothetical protein
MTNICCKHSRADKCRLFQYEGNPLVTPGISRVCPSGPLALAGEIPALFEEYPSFIKPRGWRLIGLCRTSRHPVVRLNEVTAHHAAAHAQCATYWRSKNDDFGERLGEGGPGAWEPGPVVGNPQRKGRATGGPSRKPGDAATGRATACGR